MHIAVFLWGFTGVLGRAIQLSEFPLVCYRMLITSLILAVILFYKKQLVLLSKKEIKRFASIGFLIAIHWVAFYGSIKYANASIALICLSTSSIYTALLEPVFFKRKIKGTEIILSLIAFLGMYLIYKFEINFSMGITFGLVAAMLSALFTLMNKKSIGTYPAQLVAFYEISSGLILLICLYPIYNKIFPQLKYIPTLNDFGFLLILSYACTVIGQSLALSALKKISSFTAVLTVNLEPVYGIILAYLFYHESKDLSNGFYYGISLIALSVILHIALMAYKRKKSTFK